MAVNSCAAPGSRTRSAFGLYARCALVLCIVLSVLVSGEGAAAIFPNLYQIALERDPQAQRTRAEEARLGMSLLLTRVTGSREAAFAPELRPLLDNAEQDYLDSRGTDFEGRTRLGFYASRVNQALLARNWPVWPADRPMTLLWVAFDNGLGERTILSANPVEAGASPEMTALMEDTREQLLRVADERGLPTTFPLLDLEDMAVISFTDIWGRFEDRIWAASRRYSADAVLVGRIRPGNFGPEVEWVLFRDGNRSLIGGSTVREGLDWVADIYAAEYSVAGDANTTRLTILDVSSLADYGRVMRYLESQSVLQSVEVEELDRGVLTLRVAARGGADQLERQLGLGGVLRRSSAGVGSAATAPTLVFEVARAGPSR